MGRKVPLKKYISPSQLSICLCSNALLFYYWKCLLFALTCFWASTYSKNWSHLSSCDTTMATVSCPLSKDFCIRPFFHIITITELLLSSSNKQCIFSSVFSGTVFVSFVFRSFCHFQKTLSPLTQNRHTCFLQISTKKAPYFQQKLYHINSWIQTWFLSGGKKPQEFHGVFKVINNWVLPHCCSHLI